MSAPPWGTIPFRLGLAGGWIDQPFVSEHDPEPPGSMVVVGIEPVQPFMERSGIASSTRRVARSIWPGGLPTDRPLDDLVRELYHAENEHALHPSGSQDMIGLIYPGVSRLDYDFAHEGGRFPRRIESCVDDDVCAWLESVVHVIAVHPRPAGYDALARRNLDPRWIRRLGRSGRSCWEAILSQDVRGLGAAMTESVTCWSAILPDSFTHRSLTTDWPSLLAHYQRRYPGATASASGGGYLFVASEEPVPGAFRCVVRRSRSRADGGGPQGAVEHP